LSLTLLVDVKIEKKFDSKFFLIKYNKNVKIRWEIKKNEMKIKIKNEET